MVVSSVQRRTWPCSPRILQTGCWRWAKVNGSVNLHFGGSGSTYALSMASPIVCKLTATISKKVALFHTAHWITMLRGLCFTRPSSARPPHTTIAITSGKTCGARCQGARPRQQKEHCGADFWASSTKVRVPRGAAGRKAGRGSVLEVVHR